MKLLNFFAKFLLIVFTTTYLTGCASIVSKSDYPVSFKSTPDNASIIITDASGSELYRGKTPTLVTLKSGSGYFKGASYTVTFEKENFEPRTMHLNKELDGWYLGNIIFGGLIGILIVDPATGAMWKLPAELNASLTEKTTSLIIGEDKMEMALIDDVPQSLKTKMIKVQ